MAALWVAFTPKAPRYVQTPVRVKVEQPPPQPPPPVLAQSEPTLPPVGDEKTEPQVASILPPPPTVAEEKPLPSAEHPHIAIVIDDVGLDLRGAKRATALPPFVTLSFMPYAMRLKEQTKDARDAGHELMLHMPMEPMGHEDPGPGALLTGLPPEELHRRLETALASFTGFDGVNNHMGSKFTADPAGMELVVDELQERHLFFLDSRTSARTVGETIARQHGLPTIGRDIFLDDDMALPAIRNQMEQAERVARRKGMAVVIGHPHPTTLEALESWIPDAQARGFVFVPVKELIKP